MTQDNYPIQLLVQGDVKAYCPEQIKDDLERDLRDILGTLFDAGHLAYQVKVGEQELMFTGMKKTELIETLARRIYNDRKEFCEAVFKHLAYVAELLESESGLIFVHKGTKKAADATWKLKDAMEHYSCPFDKLSIEEQAGFRKGAEEILERTIWWHSETNLLKEG